MKLFISGLIFLVCLYINYKLSVPNHEGFASPTNGIIIGSLAGGTVLICIIYMLYHVGGYVFKGRAEEAVRNRAVWNQKVAAYAGSKYGTTNN